ncbi:asparaginase [Undibacterium arcticum]
MAHAQLVEVTRGDSVECIHSGSIAIVNTRGDLLYQAGEPNFFDVHPINDQTVSGGAFLARGRAREIRVLYP